MSSFYGNASIGSGNGLPVVNSNDNGKVLVVDNGEWSVDNISNDSFEGLQNLVDGSALGSVRGINTRTENENYTIGLAAFSEGSMTYASGAAAHAEGGRTQASGDSSHAEGYETVASGTHAHAEGQSTEASGTSSHAEGANTLASGTSSHAEGKSTIASGAYSHAEGQISQASGVLAHAEGMSTLASNYGSHTEGLRTTASGEYSHAEGTVGGTFSLFGVTYTPGAASRGAHTEGYNTYANGGASDFSPHAEGSNTAATNKAAHAEGHYTLASGINAHSEGNQTKAAGLCSHAEGQFTEATGDRAHAEGSGTIASGVNSHASGNKTIANHSEQFVFGEFNIADTSSAAATERGTYVEIVGNGDAENYRSNARTLDWNGNEVLAGNLTINGGSLTLGNTTFTEQSLNSGGGSSGLQNLVDGSATGSIRSVGAEVEQTGYALGTNAFAEGLETEASGNSSHAEGYSTRAIGQAAHAEGSTSEASGYGSHAEGANTMASGTDSHAEGNSTIARGIYSHAAGYGTTAKNKSQYVFGEYNIIDLTVLDESNRGTYVEIVGNGTDNNTRSNARTLDWNGNEVLAGKLTVGAGPVNSMDVTTKQYVDNKTQPFIVHVSEHSRETANEEIEYYYTLDETAENIAEAFTQTQIILEYTTTSNTAPAGFEGSIVYSLCSQIVVKYNENDVLTYFAALVSLMGKSYTFVAYENIDFPVANTVSSSSTNPK